MSDFDHDRVSALLNIVAQCAGHSGKLGALSNEAMHELLEANAVVHTKALARKAKQEKEAAEKKAVADQATDEANTEQPPIDADGYEQDDGTIKPSVFPADSQTATIADRRI